jgi:hypothetical protein
MINTEKFNQIVEAAKMKAANSPAWLRAIEKAAKAILSGELIVTTLQHGALVTSANGTYAATDHCNCPAKTKHCYHRAGARLMDLYETAPDAVFTADVAASPREHLIIEIENIWSRVETTPLAVALMARFGVNRLDMLNDSWLRDIRLAIAI